MIQDQELDQYAAKMNAAIQERLKTMTSDELSEVKKKFVSIVGEPIGVKMVNRRTGETIYIAAPGKAE